MQGGDAKSIFAKALIKNVGANLIQAPQQQYLAPVQDHGVNAKEVVILNEHGIDGAIQNTEGDELSRVDSPPMTERSTFMGAGLQETEDTAAQLLLNQGGDQEAKTATAPPMAIETATATAAASEINNDASPMLVPREIQSPSMADQPPTMGTDMNDSLPDQSQQ